MKKNGIQDERVISQKRKIGSDAFGLVFISLLVSILIQQYLFTAPFSQYAAEYFIFFAASVYVVARSLIQGNNLFNDARKGHKLAILSGVITGLVIAVTTTALNTSNYGFEKMGGVKGIFIAGSITFLSGAVITVICFEGLYLLNQKRQKQMDAKYDDTDE